jgi:hypothetical protein
MKVTIKLFAAGEVHPRFIGALELQPSGASGSLTPETFSGEDIQMLWDVERTLNNACVVRCHIETAE